MKKICLVLLTAVLTLLCVGACADSYHFADIYMILDVPGDTYTTQLTPENLAANESFIAGLGETVDSMKEKFTQQGIRLIAYDTTHGRTLVVTAVQDAQSRELYDINEQTADTRASYRANHSNGTYCGALGYKFESCEWKNFGTEQGRFLMLKYTLREGGQVTRRGLWRRTIRNGYTITLDMQVVGRQVSEGDITAMNKLQETISFTQAEASPDAPLALTFTAPPPEFTNSASFSIKGVTRPGATVLAAYVSMKGESKTFSAQADGKGAFKVDVSLPGKDLYNMIVSVLAAEGTENEEEISRNFQVEYDPTLLPVTFTSAFPDSFTTDSFKLAGTTLSGVSVQLEVNGKLQTKQTGNAKTFAFTLDTSKEGSYEILLTFTKKNYATRVFNYTIARVFDADAQRQAIRASAVAPTYSKLKNSAASYEGKYVRANGYVVSVEPGSGEWLITFATQKKGENYSDYIMVLSDAEVTLPAGTHATLYGTGAGTYKIPGDNDKTIVYPKVSLAFFDEMSK